MAKGNNKEGDKAMKRHAAQISDLENDAFCLWPKLAKAIKANDSEEAYEILGAIVGRLGIMAALIAEVPASMIIGSWAGDMIGAEIEFIEDRIGEIAQNN